MRSFRIWNLDEACYHLERHLRLILQCCDAKDPSIQLLSELRFRMGKRSLFLGWIFGTNHGLYEVYTNGGIYARPS